MNYKALIVRETKSNQFEKKIELVDESFLHQNEVLIKVAYSGLNYKDALVARGHKGISRNYPTIPGVDVSGIVENDQSGTFKKGDKVLVTGYDLGMNTPGGFAEYVKVPANWIIPLPKELSLKESMIYGTAGVTAALCVYELIEAGISKDKGKILVTGSTGGVGSFAVAILSKLGYDVIASTGKKESHKFLNMLGAKEIIGREDVNDESGRPLLSAKWIGAIDNVGGNTLSTIIASTGQHGAVCSVGLVGNDKLNSTVYPFILRGIKLIGIDSAERQLELKKKVWEHLATDWRPEFLNKMYRIVDLDNVIPEIESILQGNQTGKVLIKVSDV